MSVKLPEVEPVVHVVIKGIISDATIAQLSTLCTNCTKRLDITFMDIPVLPKEMLEWIYTALYNDQKHVINIRVTKRRLYYYLKSLNLQSDLYEAAEINHYPSALKAIAIGGSAGSSQVIETFCKYFRTADISVFIVQHIGKDSKLLLDSLLRRYTSFNVLYPINGESVQTKTLYLAPPGKQMRISEGKILLDETDRVNYARPSVSVLFESVAKEYGNSAIAILTCGYGKDGSDVLETVRKYKTKVYVQTPDECTANVMPKNAIATNEVDYVLSMDAISSLLTFLLSENTTTTTFHTSFMKLIQTVYGYDFTQYDPKNIARRIKYEMDRTGIKDYSLYCKQVLTDRQAFEDLFFSISINVTEFFRKPSGLIALRSLIDSKFSKYAHLKIWIAGCATGEEAYTIAMILDDLKRLESSIVYATDYNWVVTQVARNGFYSKKQILQSNEISRSVLQNKRFKDFFEENGAYSSIIPSLRKKTLFFEHNLVTDGSFNEFNVITCKNVLIYFEKELQIKVIQLLYDSLQIGGYLQLGSSETLPMEFRGRFVPYNIEYKIYQKVL